MTRADGDSRAEVAPRRVVVLMGGPSAEREVSLQSGEAIARALDSLGYEVMRRDVRPDDLSALDEAADVFFIALHGTWGEDGGLQALLEQRGLRYTGCGPDASALAMDKVRTKRRLIEAGIPTASFEHVRAGDISRVAREFAVPAVIKPVAEGSSVGCTIVRDRNAFASALRRSVEQYGESLVEEYLDGPELTVGVLAGRALPVCQICPTSEFYDYHAKYEAEDTGYVFDPDVSADVVRRVQSLSERVFDVIGCRDMARVDWIIAGASEQPFCLEVNTIPGFTSHSLLPKAAERAGIDFAGLCRRLVEMAMAR